MKRIISFLTVIAVLLQLNVFGSTFDEASAINDGLDRKLAFLQALEIADADDYIESAEEIISRGKFAELLGNVVDLNAVRVVQKVRYFKDVAPNDRYGSAINLLYKKGIVKGTDDKLFSPDQAIKPYDAAVMVLRLAGYEKIVAAGYDYHKLISKNGLLDGVSSIEELTCAQAITLVCHALEMPACVGTVYTDDGGEFMMDDDHTVLYEFFKIYRHKGVLNATEGISITNSCASGRMLVNETEYKSDIADSYKYLGYFVNAYVKENKDTLDEVVYIEPTDVNEVAEFSLKNLSSVGTDLKLSYLDVKTGRQKNIQLPGNVTVIKNGKVINKNLNKAFDGEQGQVTVIKNDVKTVAVIKVYDSVMVNSVNTEDKMIYSKYGQSISFDENDSERFVIYKADGKRGTVSDIAKGMFLTVFRSDKCIEIYVSSSATEGEVTATNKKHIFINGDEFETEYDFKTSGKLPVIGAKGTFFFNIFGELAYFDESAESDLNYGILVNAGVRDEAFSKTLGLKIFTAEGKMLNTEVSDKISIDGERKPADEAYSALLAAGNNVISQMITYKITEGGVISAIDTLAENKNGGGIVMSAALGERAYHNVTNMMLPDVILKKGGPIFRVPELKNAANAADKRFSVKNELINAEWYANCSAYRSDKDIFYSDAVMIETNDAEATVFEEMDQPFMVVEMLDVLDEDDEVRKQIVLGGSVSERGGADMGIMSFMIDEDYELTESDVEKDSTADPYNSDPGKPVMPEALGEGDMIRIVRNQDNEIVKIKLLFDYSTGESMLKIRKWDTKGAAYGRYVAGFAVSKKDNFVALSTTTKGGKPTEYAHFHGAAVDPVIVMDERKTEERIYVGSYDDVITYEETGDAASVVIPVTYYGGTRCYFVYRYGR